MREREGERKREEEESGKHSVMRRDNESESGWTPPPLIAYAFTTMC